MGAGTRIKKLVDVLDMKVPDWRKSLKGRDQQCSPLEAMSLIFNDAELALSAIGINKDLFADYALALKAKGGEDRERELTSLTKRFWERVRNEPT